MALTFTLPDELITEPVHRNQMLRIRRIVLDLFTQFGDVGIDSAGERDRVITPDRVEQLLAGYDLALWERK